MRHIIALLRGVLYTVWCNHFRRNISIGKGLKVYKKIRINGLGRIQIGRDCIVGGIRGDTSHYVCIDAYYPTTVIKIGNNARLYAARIGARYNVTVGDDVFIEESGIIDTDFHSIESNRGNPVDENSERCRVCIGNRVSIGPRSLIMKGVDIGDDAVVAPGSVVANSVKPGVLVCGNPARVLPEKSSRNP